MIDRLHGKTSLIMKRLAGGSYNKPFELPGMTQSPLATTKANLILLKRKNYTHLVWYRLLWHHNLRKLSER